MGMAASQARLLCITARIHDVEFQSQAIQNAKVQLATQSDQVYQEYLEALDAKTLTMLSIDPQSGVQSTISATFNNMCSIKRLTPASSNADYALVNNKGQLVLPDDIVEKYYDAKDDGINDAYSFALYMMNETCGFLLQGDGSDPAKLGSMLYELAGDDETITSLHEQLVELVGEDIYNTESISDDKDKMSQYKDLMRAYNKNLYEGYIQQLYKQERNDPSNYEDIDSLPEELDMDKFNYYVGIYNKIQACHESICSIDDYNGTSGDVANDSEWLTKMIESGLIRIENCTTDEKTGIVTMDTINPASDSVMNFTETTSIDKTALAKAEAEYEHALSKIDKKDKQYDMSLSKLESERTALTTEYDSVKKVIQDNIERTFGIFS